MKVIVDGGSQDVRSALPGGISLPPSLINIDAGELGRRINQAIKEISDPLILASENLSSVEIEKITLSLAITATGEIALLSLLKGGSSIQSTIQVTLIPKKKSQ
ncbi:MULTISPECIES: hypothetical protein [Burkholderiaceae]|uniref:Pepco domain-containing protein n=1 Tax=Burkholderiaceae TaxID=119060 RepID=UPI0014201882|nr:MULTISPECIES: hypothetical protein [Burkholderiaceae]MBN3851659.1 hypothetical protein [Paraburkholderia sp. Ac-20342]NIF51263.1 hypothetical protein [Burkholderia sp. Ax-1724]NIF77934.1 hypothetical protein [Paraburkholderia sp. Cy-641]